MVFQMGSASAVIQVYTYSNGEINRSSVDGSVDKTIQ
jgi:hypothetical protein